jgi:hypothetical protein
MEKERATIGPSISIKGELSGEEDVVIQGRVEGKVSLDLQQDNASIASSLRRGKKARFLRLLEKNATPRVNLEEGAKFSRNIDMDSESGEKRTLKTEPISKGNTLWQRSAVLSSN